VEIVHNVTNNYTLRNSYEKEYSNNLVDLLSNYIDDTANSNHTNNTGTVANDEQDRNTENKARPVQSSTKHSSKRPAYSYDAFFTSRTKPDATCKQRRTSPCKADSGTTIDDKASLVNSKPSFKLFKDTLSEFEMFSRICKTGECFPHCRFFPILKVNKNLFK
jgi:hypothetical protein